MTKITSNLFIVIALLILGRIGGSAQVVADGTYKIVAESSGLAMAANGTSNGSAVTQQTYTGASTQQWTVHNLGSNVVSLITPGTNEALEAPGGTTTLAAALDVSSYASGTYQQWTLVSVGGGYNEVINVNSGLETNVAYNSMSPGGVICQYTVGNYPSCVWSFTATTSGAPAAPTGLMATSGNTQVSLSWTASTGATSYNIYRGTSAGGESTPAIATGISTTSFTDTTVVNGTAYYYKVAAVNASGTSGYSNEVSATPTAGGSNLIANGTYMIVAQSSALALTANGTTNGSAVSQETYTGTSTEQWALNNLGGNVVSLEVSATNEALEAPGSTTTGGATLDVSAYTSGTNQEWTLASVGNGYYEVVNVNSGLEVNVEYGSTSPGGLICQYVTGNYANGVWSFTPTSGGGGGSAPAAPTALSATAGNAQASLSWTASSGATSYNVYRGTSAGGESTTAIATGITTTGYTDTSLTNGTAYYYKVAAVNTSGTSGYSNEAIATPTAGGSNLIANGTYMIVAQSSGLALAANGTANASAVTQQTYTGASTQQWLLNNLGSNVVTLDVSGTTEALEAPGSTTTTGATLDVSAYTSGTNQKWTLASVGNGYYEVINVNSGLEVNVEYGSTSPGGAICQYGVGNYANGVWSFTPTSGGGGGSAPAAPTALSATAGNAQASLTWTGSTGATSYNLYRGTTAGGESTTPLMTGITSTSYTDTSLTNGTTYYYKVAAVNASGTSGYSNETSVTPTAGTGSASLVLAVGLERIVPGYNGPAIRIQRPSDNTQTDIGFASGSNALDTSAISNFLGTSQGWITTLYDQDGLGHNVSAPTSTDNMPTISLSAPTAITINGTSNLTARNVIMPYGPSGDGNNRYFILPSSVAVDKSQMSAFLAYRPDYSGGPYTSLYEVGNPSVDAVDIMAGNTGLQGLNHNGAVAFSNTNIMPRAQPTVLGMVTAPGTSPLLYLDGVSRPTGATAPASAVCSGGYLMAGTGTALYYGQSLFGQYNFLGFELYTGTVTASTAESISNTMLPRGTIPSFNLVIEGDSITQGIGSIYGYNMIRYTEPLLNHPADITNVALEGTPSTAAIGHLTYPTAATSVVGLLYNPSYNKNIYYIDMGTNDVIAEGQTATATWANVQQSLMDAKAMGFKTIVATLLPSYSESPAVLTQVNAYNALVRGAAGQAYLDGIIDYASDSRLGVPANYYPAYSVDGVHPNDAGYQIMSTIAAPVFNSLIGP